MQWLPFFLGLLLMPGPSVPPPLKVTQAGGTSYIPVLELVLSGGTVTKLSPIKVQYSPTASTGVAASRQILTAYPLSGGGDLSTDRTHSVDTAFMVTSARQVLTVFPLAGGGNLGIDETISANTQGFLVLSSRNVNTVYPLSGGRNLGVDIGLGVDTAFLVTSARQVLTVFPLAGGGNLGTDQTLSANTGGFLVLSSRAINTTAPLAGGGNLSADRTLTLDTAAVVTSGRTITAVFPVSGGGDLSADRSLYISTAGFLVLSSRAINTTAPLAGGGDLSVDRTHTIDTAAIVTSGRVITAGSGLTGGGNLSADRAFSINTNVRDKVFGFFAAGTLTTVMLATSARIYIPFNMELRDVRLAVVTTPVGANIITNLYQFPTPVSVGSAFFTSALRPMVATGGSVGSAGTLSNNVMYSGSWLGFSIDQVGTTSTGESLTMTAIVRTS